MLKKRGLIFTFAFNFCLLIVIPILGLSLLFGKLYQDILVDNVARSLLQAESNIASTLEYEIGEASLLLSSISHANDSEILELATEVHKATDQAQRYNLSRQLNNNLNYTLLPRKQVASLVFFYENGGSDYYRSPMVGDEEQIRSMPWYEAALSNNSKTYVIGVERHATHNARNQYAINVALSLENRLKGNDVELVWFSFFTNALDQERGPNTGVMLVVDEKGTVVLSDDKSLEGQNAWSIAHLARAREPEQASYRADLDGESVLVTAYAIKSVDWKVLNYVPYSLLTQDARQLYGIFVAVIAAVLGVFIIFSTLFVRGILSPIDRLVVGMQRLENSDFTVSLEPTGNIDLRKLTGSFNNLVGRMEDLMHEIMHKEQQRITMEMEVLQAQINPHFYANALNAIRFMAVVAQYQSIQQMTEALINIFTSSFGKSTRVSVGQEIEIVKSYLYLMQIRYNGKFEVEYEIQAEVLEESVPKLILQPLVENAVLHGFLELDRLGKITIRGYRQGTVLVLEVEDNGHGMREERIRQVLGEDAPRDESGHGIGLSNTLERIKLNYSSGYGIKIHSRQEEYTRVTMTLPTRQAYTETD